jgi:trk system potassium uptake protein TrkH
MLTAIPFSLYYKTDDISSILGSAVLTAAAGTLMYVMTSKEGEIGHKEGICIVTFGWILAAGFGALPFHFYGTFPTYADAYFEAMSGFTTTGASVLADVEKQPAGILFWRSLTHWMGGMGIVVLSLAILPALGAGGMQLYKAEVPGPSSDKLVPRLRETSKRLYVVYSVISVAEVALWSSKYALFDSLTHMFGTMGTGGFSPKNASVGYYQSAYVDLVIAAFMFIAGANFLLHYNAMARREFKGYLTDEEFRFYSGIVGFFTVTVALSLVIRSVSRTFSSRCATPVLVVSIITTRVCHRGFREVAHVRACGSSS